MRTGAERGDINQRRRNLVEGEKEEGKESKELEEGGKEKSEEIGG